MRCSNMQTSCGRLAAAKRPPRPGAHPLPQPGGRNALTMTATGPPRRWVTVREIAAERGISVYTVRRHRQSTKWPRSARVRRTGARQRPELEYPAAAVARFYAGKEAASAQAKRGPRHTGDWARGELVDGPTAAARLGISWSAFRGYPAMYRGSGNPVPEAVERGRWRWGDIADWDDQRKGSGNRLPRAAAEQLAS